MGAGKGARAVTLELGPTLWIECGGLLEQGDDLWAIGISYRLDGHKAFGYSGAGKKTPEDRAAWRETPVREDPSSGVCGWA